MKLTSFRGNVTLEYSKPVCVAPLKLAFAPLQ